MHCHLGRRGPQAALDDLAFDFGLKFLVRSQEHVQYVALGEHTHQLSSPVDDVEASQPSLNQLPRRHAGAGPVGCRPCQLSLLR
jgi:hypothetical protein